MLGEVTSQPDVGDEFGLSFVEASTDSISVIVTVVIYQYDLQLAFFGIKVYEDGAEVLNGTLCIINGYDNG
jgi:hypothetical protein